MFQNKNLSVLGSNLLLKGLDESIINSVFNSKNFRAEKEGELIFQAGDESNHLYLILQGEVKLKYSGTKGSNGSFRRVKNEFFGELEVLEKTSRISSAVADKDCIFYLISKEELFLLINQYRDILKNLSYTPVDDEEIFEDEEYSTETVPEQNQNADNEEATHTDAAEKHVEEIIMDEDLADYSFDNPAIEELPDFHDENYLSYSGKEEEGEDFNFNNNGFHPEEEKQFEEKSSAEVSADYLNNEDLNDTLPEQPDEFFHNDVSEKSDELIPAINDFEHIPEEPQKFAFIEKENSFISYNSQTENQQAETETLSAVDGASKFINFNILFQINEIKKLTDLLSEYSTLPEAVQVKELITKHINSMQTVISSTLEFVADKNEFTLTKQNIRIVLNNILNLLSEYVETRNIKLYKKIDTDIDVEVDEARLYNVFLQLAKNACDSMPEGGNIFVTSAQEGNKVKIEFIDEGIGIPSSLTFEVFEPMFTHGKQNGTGLGLSIAKKIILDHKGDISIDGELGEGTRIVITLPVTAAEV